MQEHKVCKLVKSLYGLKQVLKQWHKKFDKVIVSNGFNIMNLINVSIVDSMKIKV